ncbi:MAG: hypothetical protein CUN56_01320 [Phototrophicales bacterium]|nr:MAG: hypothetical protein CUN56_01320 [Phototrophicales bacterium]
MGIRLDWEVETEKTSTRTLGEDPATKRQRRRARLNLLLAILGFAGVIVGAFWGIKTVIDEANNRLETSLRDTVEAEITALRIGDINAFLRIQRSATDAWEAQQRAEFNTYQEILYRSETTQLTGQILDIEIDDPRARVAVQEIIDGVPYTRIWFYWRYDEDIDELTGRPTEGGWRHVPPDYTFWEAPGVYDGQYVDVNYLGVDAEFGRSMGSTLDEWIQLGCRALDCTALQPITVSIQPSGVPTNGWDAGDQWLLRVISPYISRARSDMPFSPQLRNEIGQIIAERLVLIASGSQWAEATTDAAFVQQSIIAWLLGRFTQVDTGTYFISSLATLYDDAAVGQLLKAVIADNRIAVLSQITGTSLDQSLVDWRDYFTFRLGLENRYIQEGNSTGVFALYVNTPEMQQAALDRLNQRALAQTPTVTLVQGTYPSPDGAPQLVATVRLNDVEYQVLFRLVGDEWLRAS